MEPPARSSSAPRGSLTIVLVLFTLACGVILAAVLVFLGGDFVYTLDDAYIHLALAENILHGHYGLEPGSVSAPSSSVLWPFVLAPFAWLAFAGFVPLALNYLASLGTILLFAKTLRWIAAEAGARWTRTLEVGFLLILILATNLLGLAFTGLEHSLQLMTSAAMFWGLVRFTETNRVPWWLVAAAVLGPLLRYENLALTLPFLVVLVWKRRVGALLICSALIAVTLGGFTGFLLAHDLGVVPSSLIVKSGVMSGAGRPVAIVRNTIGNLLCRQGAVLAGMLIALIIAAARRRREDRARILLFWSIAVLLLHLGFGRFGWFERYEIYAWTVGILALLFGYRSFLVGLLVRVRPARILAVSALILVVVAFPYLYSLLKIPLAAANTYEQHYQMHRFVTEFYRKPVAAHDVGWVSYRNPAFVLDLWGLSSKRALTSRLRGGGTAWMDALAREHDVKVAMLYRYWFPAVPASWTPVAELNLKSARITAAHDVVTFYALDGASVPGVRALLRDFKKSLPSGIRLDLL